MSPSELLKKYQEMPMFEGCNVNSFSDPGIDGDAPIHVAAYLGEVEALKTMVSLDTPLNVKGDIGNSPLHYAALGKRVECIELLVRNGADVAATNDYGDRPVDLADGDKDSLTALVLPKTT